MKKLRLSIVFFLFITYAVLGQEQPKVGLVLSGGGAKGLAHIGALKVIERENIKIDYIAGTSMGAIIGGLYASGYSTKQLDSIFRKTDFNSIIQDKITYRSRSFFSREFGNKYVASLPFENFKIKIPSGLSKGQNLYNLLKKLTLIANNDRFKNTKIPFFCMATDLETAQDLQLEKGPLAISMIASGSIPSIFKPVNLQGRLLSDGGITDNYPIERLKAKGMDKIIGVNVQDSLVKRDQLETGIEVITQINNFRTVKDMRKKRPQTDIYIRPDIRDFNVLSFDKGKSIIKAGEEAALKKINKLKSLPKTTSSNQRNAVKIREKFKVRNIILKGDFDYPRNYIMGKLDLRKKQEVTYEDINEGINNLSSTDNFKSIRYQIVSRSNKKDLIFKLQQDQKNQFLKFAAHYDDLYKGGVLVNLTRKSVIFENDITSLDFILGQNLRYNFNYYIDNGSYWSLGLRSRLNKFEDNVDFEFLEQNSNISEFDINEVRLDFSDFTNQFYLETYYNKTINLKGGIEHKSIEASTKTILADIDPENEDPETIIEDDNLLSVFGKLKFDSLDDSHFPTKGFYFNGMFNYYFASLNNEISVENFSIAKGDIGTYFKLYDKIIMHIHSGTGFRIGNEKLSGLNFFLGGYGNKTINNFKPFYGYDFFSLSADSYIKGLAEVDLNFYKKNHIILSANYANVDEDIYTDGEWFSTPDFTGYAIGYSCDTVLGPVNIKYTYSPEVKDGLLYFSLGYRF